MWRWLPRSPLLPSRDLRRCLRDFSTEGSSYVEMGNFSSLECFLHFRVADWPTDSFYYSGTAYENLALSALEPVGVKAIRVGGKADGGIDFRGRWHDDKGAYVAEVVGQCKRISHPAPPKWLREMEGTLSLEISRQCKDLPLIDSPYIQKEISMGEKHPSFGKTLGILVSSSGFTAHTIRSLRDIPSPMCLLHLDEDGVLRSVRMTDKRRETWH